MNGYMVLWDSGDYDLYHPVDKGRAFVNARNDRGRVFAVVRGELVADYRERVPRRCPAEFGESRCWYNNHKAPYHLSLDGDSIRAWEGGRNTDYDPRKITARYIARAVREHDERERASADN